MKKKIIILDDDEGILEILKEQLSEFSVIGFTDVEDALLKIRQENFDLFILDYFLFDCTGAEIIERVRRFNEKIYIFLLTGYKDTIPGLESLNRLNIQFYCEKSANVESIIINIKSVLKTIDFMKQEKSDTLASRLKQLRIAFNLSQEDIAKVVGDRGRTTICNWEAGLAEPSLDALKKLASFFGVTIDYLLCHETDYLHQKKATENVKFFC
jgi:DNA-binding NtrC family response regulator